MEQRLVLTREEIERRLEKGLIGKIVSFPDLRDKTVTGKVQRLSVNVSDNKELLVSFQVDTLRYEFDLHYFANNITIHGNTPRTDDTNVRRILKGN
jgi:hypothetical protein